MTTSTLRVRSPWLHLPAKFTTRRGCQLVRWIAENDNPGDDEHIDALMGYLTVVMLAHVYDVAPVQIAETVYELRHPVYIREGVTLKTKADWLAAKEGSK